MHLLVAAHDFYPDPGSGGTGRYVYETTTRLADRGHDVSVLTRRRGDVPSRETIGGVRVARYDLEVAERSAPAIARQLPTAVRAVRDHLDALPDPDLLSFQGTVTDPLADLLVADDVPRSATFHSPWPTEYRIRAGHEADGTGRGFDRSAPRRRLNAALRERIERRTLAECEQVLALSRFMAGTLREVHGPVADPEIVPGGVDTERYRPDAGVYGPMADGRPPTEPDAMVDGGAASESGTDFLTVRRLSPRMGHGMLLRAFRRVVESDGAPADAGPHLYVAGDGPLRGELERLAADLGIADSVTFLGYVPDDDLPGAYAAADCFVLPTRELEGFGLATLEALASGTPVVATPVGGTTEILSSLRGDDRIPTEMVVESVDADSLAERMRTWAALSPAERADAGRACRDHARRNYTWDSTADALEAKYRELV
ncbi:glycosyltransferase family 4 protein (plasmid) [Halorussus limi]|uniref:Glycosyltransferase family 4 protein n=1 Tax=Halorussus limi TaxID=2938695 RepID=A0A8U0HZ72_9EURY|nr:glycosyltransferase family 4 protein [Halorussus limi]UPV76435.1 glycosyltransferase family 4 protein [Halorussus limi]